MTILVSTLRVLLATCMLPIWSWQAAAEETAAPPVIPDLSFKPTERDVWRYSDYFYFHKDGVAYEKALADLKECSSYSRAITPMGAPPDFVPLGGAPDPNAKSEFNQRAYASSFVMYGLVGVALAAIVLDSSSTERSNDRRCMGYLGYQRYGLSKAIWSKLTKGSDEENLEVFALIASGPHPTAESLKP